MNGSADRQSRLNGSPQQVDHKEELLFVDSEKAFSRKVKEMNTLQYKDYEEFKSQRMD